MATFTTEGTEHDAKIRFANAIIGVIYDDAAGAYYDSAEFKFAVLDQFDNFLDYSDQIKDAYDYPED